MFPYRTKGRDFTDTVKVPGGISVVIRDLRKGRQMSLSQKKTTEWRSEREGRTGDVKWPTLKIETGSVNQGTQASSTKARNQITAQR